MSILCPISHTSQTLMSRKERLDHALSIALMPDRLIINDESDGHNVPKGSESHFKVIAVSRQFINVSRIARHRLVNSCVSEEFKQGLHALSLHLYTPDEWTKQALNVLPSPVCHNKK